MYGLYKKGSTPQGASSACRKSLFDKLKTILMLNDTPDGFLSDFLPFRHQAFPVIFNSMRKHPAGCFLIDDAIS